MDGEFAVAAAELGGDYVAEFGDFGLDFEEEGGVGEGSEGVQVGFGRVAREEEEVDGGFGVEVVDGDEVGVVVDYAGGVEGFGAGEVGAEAIAAGEEGGGGGREWDWAF